VIAVAVAVLVGGCGATPRPAPTQACCAGGAAIRTEQMTAESDIAYEVTTAGLTVPRQRWAQTWWTRELRILAADRGRVTRVAVTYRRHGTTSRMSGADRVDERSPLAGRSFIVEAGDGELAVTAGDGRELAAHDADLVRDDHRWVGKPDAIAALLRRITLRVGAAVTVDEGVVATLVGAEPPDQFRGRATVLRIEAAADGTRQVVLGLQLAAQRDDDGWFRITNRLAGTLVIDLTHRRALELTLAGQIRHFERTARRTVIGAGAGRARLHWTATYR
jgi:hypothetical protein